MPNIIATVPGSRQANARRFFVLFLILAVVLLSAAAKHSQFLPFSDPGHFVSSSYKLNLTHSPDVLPIVIHSAPEILPAQTDSCAFAVTPPETFEIPQLRLTLSLQHRSPPLSI